MSEERMRVLHMLAEGKLTAEEAEKLLQALEGEPKAAGATPWKQSMDVKGKYLYVQVEPKEGKSSERVSVKVPLALVKAGLNISKLIPVEAQDKIQTSMQESGIPFKLSEIDTQNFDEIIEALEQMSIDVDTDESTVKVFCR
jgi:polyhydroxyalkanoate synthesis regulator phasin